VPRKNYTQANDCITIYNKIEVLKISNTKKTDPVSKKTGIHLRMPVFQGRDSLIILPQVLPNLYPHKRPLILIPGPFNGNFPDEGINIQLPKGKIKRLLIKSYPVF